MIVRNTLITVAFAILMSIGLTWQVSAQIVPNDVCSDALPFPPLVSNVTSCLNGTNIGANGELPYINQGYCLGGVDMPAPAADIWYSFTAVSNILDIDISFDTEAISVALYEGTCGSLIGRECEVGFGGALNTTFAPVAPGVVYFIQISGTDLTDQGEFGICIENYADNIDDICILGQTLNVSPPPLLGTYPPGENINFCFTVAGYNQNAADWLHGLVPVFGNGWDVSTLGPSSPASCSGSGTWSWYELVQGTSAYAATIGPQGPGFFYETASGGPGLDTDPGNNYGDVGATGCPWTFCFSISTLDCPPGENEDDLSITFLNFSDSETGSWGAFSICPLDPEYTFKALLACCAAPEMSGVNPSCANPNGGSVTATPTAGTPPYVWEWSNGFAEETSGASTISNLPEGFYTVTVTDNTGCSVAASYTLIEQSAGLNIQIPVSVEGCSGCEVSPDSPGNIDIVNQADGTTFATVSINSCPGIINICLPETGAFSLSYNGQVIENAVINSALTAPLFVFNSGSPSFAGTMNEDTDIICNGLSTALSNNGDEILDNGAILTYALYSNPANVAGSIIAHNPTGTFSGTGLIPNTPYYVSAIAGPEGATPGLPDLSSACTDISNATPVVFLTPVSIIINESCDWLTGDYHLLLYVTGGYPSYDNTATYHIVGDYNDPQLPVGESVEIIFLEGSTTAYSFEVISDGFGCTGSSADEEFICYKTPIELLSFTGRVQPQGNQLLWSTATEVNNDYFTLERSTDGVNFEVIGTVKSQGNSITVQSYEFLDKNAPAGLSYYRLSDTDFNGTRTYANNIVSLRREATGLAIVQVSPVPASDKVNINFSAPDNETITLELYNVAGQLIHNQKIQSTNGLNQVQLDVNTYPSGMYLVSIQSATDRVVTKLVVE